MQTDFSQIQFDPQYHSYTLNGQRLKSATSLINKLKPKFDADYWAERKAAERGVTPQEIKNEWAQKRDASVQKGELVHRYIEKLLKGQLMADPFLSLNTRLPEMTAFEAFWNNLNEIEEISVSQIEWIIGDVNLKIAGRPDALLYVASTDQYHIWDWKTNSKFQESNNFGQLAAPFADLDDCEMAVYSLQSSLYRLIVERNTSLPVGDSYIVHLQVSGHYQIYKAWDLRGRLLDWLVEAK